MWGPWASLGGYGMQPQQRPFAGYSGYGMPNYQAILAQMMGRMGPGWGMPAQGAAPMPSQMPMTPSFMPQPAQPPAIQPTPAPTPTPAPVARPQPRPQSPGFIPAAQGGIGRKLWGTWRD